MRTLSWLAFVLAAAGFFACATVKKERVAVDPDKPTLGVEEPAAPADDDMECRWIIPTGSSLRKKVCKSRFEWEAEHQSAQDFLQRPRAGPQIGH